ncbi:AAA family ATPase [Vibrio splendidus]|uniref:AAA family ATPase n=1 Tax=Vibrio splendidus TaxID=29497 RepID=UPI000769E56C|nr:ParA family protein [Vibrio splendidus]
MFNLVDKLSAKDEQTPQVDNHCAVLFQSEDCRTHLVKAFRFEGLSEPISLDNQPESTLKLTEFAGLKVVMVELNNSDDVVRDAQQIALQLPTHLSVIIIGREDAITTIRALKDLGFYYLFWPASEVEVTDFYRSVLHNHLQHQGVARNRKAKQIAFVGVKGGVGTSLIASEVSRCLAKQYSLPTLLVDHTYTGSNLDVMLGLKKFQKRNVQKGTLVSAVDTALASNLVQSLENNLSILAVESQDFNRGELHEYTQALTKQVEQNSSFIIEDYSHSTLTQQELFRALADVDSLVLVFDATVSSLRELNRIVGSVQAELPAMTIVTVMNHTRPSNAASVSKADVVKHFGQAANCHVEFDHKANQYLLQGELITETRSEMQLGLTQLVAILLGEQVVQKTKMSWLSWFKR